MGISIHIEDVSKEQPEALWRTGMFLLDMAVEGGYDEEIDEPVAPAPAAPADNAFGDMMQLIISNVSAGKITQPQVIEIVQGFGLPHVGAVFQRQDLIPQILEKIEALL